MKVAPVDACFFQDPLDQSAIFEFTTPSQLDNSDRDHPRAVLPTHHCARQAARPAAGAALRHYAMALQAAVDGVGVAIGLRPYVEDDLASGRLVAPFKLAVPKRQAWYLVYRPFRQDDAALTAFRDWLIANVERDPGRDHDRVLAKV